MVFVGYNLKHRATPLWNPLRPKYICILFSFYQISPNKNQNIKKILSDSEP